MQITELTNDQLERLKVEGSTRAKCLAENELLRRKWGDSRNDEPYRVETPVPILKPTQAKNAQPLTAKGVFFAVFFALVAFACLPFALLAVASTAASLLAFTTAFVKTWVGRCCFSRSYSPR